MTEILVNGAARDHEAGTTVRDIVTTLAANPEGCAVAVNDAVVPRSDWSTRTLEPGDRVEVLTAVQGG
jgi:sulfur carrier protein